MRLAPGVDPQAGLLVPRSDGYVPLLRVRWGGDTTPSGWDVIPTRNLPVGTREQYAEETGWVEARRPRALSCRRAE